jgi:hypothetical protein
MPINNVSPHQCDHTEFILHRPAGPFHLSISTFYRLTCVLQMGKKRGGLPLRKELDNIQYLQSHPNIHHYFSDVGCLTYVERLQGLPPGYHRSLCKIL